MKNTKAIPKKSLFRRIIRWIFWCFLGLILLVLGIILFIRSPFGQQWTVAKITNYVSATIKTPFHIDQFFVTFSGNLAIEGMYLADQENDTLLYFKSLEVSIPIKPILFDNHIGIKSIESNGLVSYIKRKKSNQEYNFQYIIDAFANENEAESKTSSPYTFAVDNVQLTDFKLDYKDEVESMHSLVQLGAFTLSMKLFDLENLAFQVEDIVVKNAQINHHQSKKFKKQITQNQSIENQNNEILPTISWNSVSFENVAVAYQDENTGLKFEGLLADLQADKASVNLQNNKFKLKKLALANSTFQVNMAENREASLETSTSDLFEWPDYSLDLGKLQLANNSFQFTQGEAVIKAAVFDPKAIELKEFNLSLLNAKIAYKNLQFDLEQLSFKESSGFDLQQLALNLESSQNHLLVDSLVVETSRNQLSASLDLDFQDVVEWINRPQKFKNSQLDLHANLDFAEFGSYFPNLLEVPYFKEVSKNKLQVNSRLEGDMEAITLQKLESSWGNTTLSAEGFFQNLTKLDDFQYDVDNFRISTTSEDILQFMTISTEGITIPQKMTLTGRANGDLKNLSTQSQLQLAEGIINVNASIAQQENIEIKTEIGIDGLALGKIIQQKELQPVTASFSATAKGSTWQTLQGEAKANFSSLTYAAFDASNMDLTANLNNQQADVFLNLNHKDVKFTSKTSVVFDRIQPSVDVFFDLKGADLQSLGLTKKDLRVKSQWTANYEGNEEKFSVQARIDSTTFVHNSQTFSIKPIALKAISSPLTTEMEVDSGFLTADLQANVHFEALREAILQHLKTYVNQGTEFRKTDRPAEMKVQLRLQDTPFISEVLLEKEFSMDTLTMAIELDEKTHQLSSKIRLPSAVYGENELKSLSFDFNSLGHQADFQFGFEKLSAGVLKIAKTQLSGDYQDHQLQLRFEAYKNAVEFFNIHSQVDFYENEIGFKIKPDNLILNEKPWQIKEDNAVKWCLQPAEQSLHFTSFEITRNQQYIGFRDDFDLSVPHVGMVFRDFKLSTLTSYLNSDENFAKGMMSGDFIVTNPFGNLGFISDLKVENLTVMQQELGMLSFNAISNERENYALDFSIKGNQLDFEARGKIDNTGTTPAYSLDAQLIELQMPLIQELASEYIDAASGTLKASIKVEGTKNALDYQGTISVQNTAFNVKFLNTQFQLDDEQINLTTDQLYFDKFIVKDAKSNTFEVNGLVSLEDFQNPVFDVSFQAKDFQALNSTQKDNDLYFGKLNFDADIKLLGDLNFPKVEGSLTVNEKTNVTYRMPATQVSTVEREGVVVFVNKKNPDDILTRTDDSQLKVQFSGIEINSILKINPQARVNVVINRKTGDNVQLVGGGEVQYKLSKNGSSSLFGTYEVTEGQFEMNLYNLVTRKFQLAKGSTVKWTGDPYNADLSIKTIYTVETSASSLMAAQTSAASSSIQNQYRQQLPFQVYLMVDGEIGAPELNFKLDMPENTRGAINGSVYNQVMQINQQEDVLNKQVFSLLVLNRFYPTAGSDGSQGGAATIARNNINQALSDQLNTYANKLTGNTGIQLSFDVNSYTDFQSGKANNRTDVDINAQKKLLDDRLIVEAGSQVNVEGDLRPGESNVALGNLSVQYLLTEDGRWKVKGFRKSEYENVIDGQVFISGIALIFTREFNRFKELWNEKLNTTTDRTSKKQNVEKEQNEKASKATDSAKE